MTEQTTMTIRLELHGGDATHYVFWPKPSVVICDVVRLNYADGVWTVEGECEEKNMVFMGYAEEKAIALAQYLRMRLASLSLDEPEEKKEEICTQPS